MKINHPDWYSSYLNPTFEEILELAKSGWDTCRILMNPDNNDLVIASGYGNTHSSIAERYRVALGKRRIPSCESYILYHENRIALLNLEDVSGSQRARVADNLDLFGKHQDLIKDLIRESDLSL
jgi:hypothetical protein